MNQILISEKLYITPELKRKKKLYKIDFIISVFLLCLLFSYYIYAEYDKYAGEKKSQEILANMELPKAVQSTYVYDDTTIKVEENERMVIILSEEDTETMIDADNLDANRLSYAPSTRQEPQYMTSDSGEQYYPIAKINIPKLGWDAPYPILDHWTDELLKIAPCKFHGSDPNEVGNFCIVGHNYRNEMFFSKVPGLANGDIIEIEDGYGRKVEYAIYDKHIVDENDTRDTSQVTHGKKEITIITCTNDGHNRVIVKAREKK